MTQVQHDAASALALHGAKHRCAAAGPGRATARNRLLLIADDRDAARLLYQSLNEAADDFIIDLAPPQDGVPEPHAQHRYDAVILDLVLPHCEALGCVRRVKEGAGEIPVLVLACADDESLALQAVTLGAQDYLVKGQIAGSMLARAIRHAIERQHVHNALRENEARYRLLFETMAQGVIYQDAAGNVTDANPAAQHILGRTLDDMRDGILPVPRWYAAQPDSRAAAGTVPSALPAPATAEPRNGTVMRILNASDLTQRWVLVHTRPEFLVGDNVPYHVITTFTDITHLRAAENAAQLQRQMLETVYGKLPVMIVLYDSLGVVQWVNECWLTTVGWTIEEMRAPDFFQRIHPDPAERARVIEVIEANDAVSCDFSPQTRDGRQLDTCWLHVALPDGTSIGIGQDITEQRRAEAAVRTASTKLSAILDTSPVPIIAVSPDTTVILWNRAAERVFGWSAADVVGRPYPVKSPDSDEPQRTFTAVLNGQEQRNHEVRRFTRDGRLLDLSLWNASIRDATGEVTALVGIFVDMTAHRELEHQLQHAQKMEAVGRMAGGVAHDFNNILTAIAGHADLGLEAMRHMDPLRPELVEIRRGVDRAATLTRQLLAFSRKQVTQPRVLCVRDCVVGMELMLRRLIGEHIEFHVDAEGAGNVFADQGHLEQIIVNLVVNARDALSDKGRIDVRAANAVLAPPFAAGFAYPPDAGRYAMVSVADNGHGMPAHVLAHIFEPFFTTKEAGKGTGLGLSTIYGLVKQSRGFISVDSAVGTGTCFRIYLPLIPLAAQNVEVPVPHRVTAVNTETVLLVEDEPAVRAIAARVLRREGYTVLLAKDGSDALTVARAHAGSIEIVVTDLIMPHLNGLELAQQICAERPAARVLFMSGYSDEILSDIHQNLSSVPLLEKPFRPTELACSVRAVLDRPSEIGSPAARP